MTATQITYRLNTPNDEYTGSAELFGTEDTWNTLLAALPKHHHVPVGGATVTILEQQETGQQ